MRQIQIVVPDDRVDEFLKLLENYDKVPLHTEATGPFDTIIVRVMDDRVDELVEVLKHRGVEDEGSIFILPKGVMISRKEDISEEEAKLKKIAPCVELRAHAEESSELTRSFFYMTIISAFVATLGLMLNSTAVVIGAMLVAPLLGPSISICVGTVLGEPDLFRSSMVNTFIGLATAIGISIITAFITIRSGLITPLFDPSNLPPEIIERTNLNVLNIGLALASGAAGAYSFAERKGEILVGVMIAVALMPPACVAGIGIALLDMTIFFGAIMLLIINVICINIAGTLVLWKIGVRPRLLFKELESEKHVKKRVTTTLIILVLISAVFGYTTFDAYRDFQFKEDIEAQVNSVAQSLHNVTDYDVDQITIDRKEVTVDITLYAREGDPPQDSSQVIWEALDQKWGDDYDFTVNVVIQRVQKSG